MCRRRLCDGILIAQHLFSTVTIRRQAVEFLRSVVCASLPSVLISNEKKIEATKSVFNSLRKFISYSRSPIQIDGTTKTCKSCALQLGTSIYMNQSTMPIILAIVCRLSESEKALKRLNAMHFSSALCVILEAALRVWRLDDELFERNQSDCERKYSELYCNVAIVPSNASTASIEMG